MLKSGLIPLHDQPFEIIYLDGIDIKFHTFPRYIFSFLVFFRMITNNSLHRYFLSVTLCVSLFLGYKEETRIKDFWDDGDDKVVFRKNFTDRDYFCDKF